MLGNRADNASVRSIFTTSFDKPSNIRIQSGDSYDLNNCMYINSLQSSTCKQTKMVIVPIFALIEPTSTYNDSNVGELLSDFKNKFADKDKYIFIIDYRHNAVFSIVDLDTDNNKKSEELPPYTLPIYTEPQRYWEYPNYYDPKWHQVWCGKIDNGVSLTPSKSIDGWKDTYSQLWL